MRGNERYETSLGCEDLVNCDTPVILMRTNSFEGRIQKKAVTQRCNLQQVFVRGETLTGMTEMYSRSDTRLYPVILRTITLHLFLIHLVQFVVFRKKRIVIACILRIIIPHPILCKLQYSKTKYAGKYGWSFSLIRLCCFIFFFKIVENNVLLIMFSY